MVGLASILDKMLEHFSFWSHHFEPYTNRFILQRSTQNCKKRPNSKKKFERKIINKYVQIKMYILYVQWIEKNEREKERERDSFKFKCFFLIFSLAISFTDGLQRKTTSRSNW